MRFRKASQTMQGQWDARNRW